MCWHLSKSLPAMWGICHMDSTVHRLRRGPLSTRGRLPTQHLTRGFPARLLNLLAPIQFGPGVRGCLQHWFGNYFWILNSSCCARVCCKFLNIFLDFKKAREFFGRWRFLGGYAFLATPLKVSIHMTWYAAWTSKEDVRCQLRQEKPPAPVVSLNNLRRNGNKKDENNIKDCFRKKRKIKNVTRVSKKRKPETFFYFFEPCLQISVFKTELKKWSMRINVERCIIHNPENGGIPKKKSEEVGE